jgi:hypothetical protein
MKRVFTATCLAVLCGAGLAAQTQADDQKRKATEPAKMEEKTVTLTGCLRAGDTPNSFVLANVKTAEAAGKAPDAPTPPAPPTPPSEPPSTPPSTPPAPPTPTPPQVPASPTPPAGSTVGTSGAIGSGDVRLVGAPANVDLSKHVGHTVEITGTFVPASKATKPTGTSGTAGTAAADDTRSLTVKSMAHKSATCN